MPTRAHFELAQKARNFANHQSLCATYDPKNNWYTNNQWQSDWELWQSYWTLQKQWMDVFGKNTTEQNVLPRQEDGQLLDEIAVFRTKIQELTDKLSQMRDNNAEVGDVIHGKYGKFIRPFVTLMDKELHANSGKGDQEGWLQMSPQTCLLEIYYHVAKLQKAVNTGNTDLIKEHSADVANISMMLLDIHGLLDNGEHK